MTENIALVELNKKNIADASAKEKALNDEISKLKAEISQLKGRP